MIWRAVFSPSGSSASHRWTVFGFKNHGLMGWGRTRPRAAKAAASAGRQYLWVAQGPRYGSMALPRPKRLVTVAATSPPVGWRPLVTGRRKGGGVPLWQLPPP